MHSHDRTLLSRLGFADPDKTNPEHDRACRYLSLLANREALFQAAGEPLKSTLEDERNEAWERRTGALCEFAISKGEGMYKTTIGFVDVVLTSLREPRERGTFDFGVNGPTERLLPIVGIEVKISPVAWGEVLRQIKLYREYLYLRWILAVRFDVTEEYMAALKNEGIAVIRLGKKFEEWIAQDQKISATLKEI